MSEKIQKVLASMGMGSRRQVEAWLQEGRIQINGRPAKLGDRMTRQDNITVNGRFVKIPAEEQAQRRVLLYNKCEGEMCTRRDPEGRPTVFRRLPSLHKGRWVAVGRLDINSCGLLLFTNDGELANRLMHPSAEIEREYAVRVYGNVDEQVIQTLRQGVELEDGFAKFSKVVDAGGEGRNHWYHVVLSEGRKREVRRLWESQGVRVSRLIRVRFGDITLPRSLRSGHHQELTTVECEQLARQYGLSSQPAKPSRRFSKKTIVRGKK